MSKKPLGIVLWKGKSLFDGERIMAIATGVFTKSENRKTGDMIQVWIMRRDISPMFARRMGEDYSVCKDCMHRENSTCYVNIGQAPTGIYKAYHDGRYRDYVKEDNKYFKGKNVRIGSYGDPASIPYEVWENLCSIVKSYTSYSHQWSNCDQRLKTICMASVDSIKNFDKEYRKAQSMGWRTFRVRESADNPLTYNEFVCPASKEGGQKTTCEKCGLCSGLSSPITKSIAIILHGDSEATGNFKYKRFIKVMKLRKNKKAWRRDYKTERKQYKEICKF